MSQLKEIIRTIGNNLDKDKFINKFDSHFIESLSTTDRDSLFMLIYRAQLKGIAVGFEKMVDIILPSFGVFKIKKARKPALKIKQEELDKVGAEFLSDLGEDARLKVKSAISERVRTMINDKREAKKLIKFNKFTLSKKKSN